MEKTGFKIEGGADSEGVVLTVMFAVASTDEALALEKTLGAAVGGGKGKKDKADKADKGAAGKKGKKAKDEEEDDEDEDDDEDEESEDDEDDEDEESDEDDEDDDEESEDDEDEEDEDEKPKKGKKGKDKEEKGKGGKIALKLTDKLKNATKLREVLVELMEQGVKDQKKLVEACKLLQPKLAVLKQIKDLETRVPRAAALIQDKK